MPAFVADTAELYNYVAKRALRRIDHYARMALLGGYLALDDAGISADQCANIGIIIASGYGATVTTFNFLDSIASGGDSCASPTNFSNSVHNVAAAYLSMQLQAFGPNATVSQFEMSVSSALYTAACWLEQGRVDTIIFGSVDEHSRVLDYCCQRYFADGCDDGNLAKNSENNSPKIRPFSFEKQSAIAADGAAFMVLSSAAERKDGTKDAGQQYGFISALECGKYREKAGNDTAETNDDLLLLGADGHKCCAAMYAQLQNKSAQISCSPSYGSLPTGQAFDVIAAALMLRDQQVYGVASDDFSAKTFASIDAISCVKFAADGQMGSIRVTRGDNA